MMKLNISGGRTGLAHGANDVRTLMMRRIEESREDIGQRSNVMEIVQKDHSRYFSQSTLNLFSKVCQVLVKLLPILVVHTVQTTSKN